MSDNRIYSEQAPVITEVVFFTGTTALSAGQGLCYDRDYYTSTTGQGVANDWGGRANAVALPSSTTNFAFAGVAVQAYAANASGQYVTIYKPGSVCPVLTDQNCAISEKSLITVRTDATKPGVFAAGCIEGKGTARVMQTVDRSSTNGLVLAELLTGAESGGVEYVTLTAGANTLQIGGVTRLQAATLGGPATATLANGTFEGQRKVVLQDGTLTTYGLVLTVTTGRQIGVTTALASLTFSAGAGGKAASLVWTAGAWQVVGMTATSPVAA